MNASASKSIKDLEEELRTASTTEKQTVIIEKILGRFPYLYAYWLRLIQNSTQPELQWQRALENCPTIELWVEYLKSPYGTSEASSLSAEKALGEHFQAHHIYDIMLARTEGKNKILRKLIRKPLYNNAQYMKKAKELQLEPEDVLTQISLENAQEIKNRWRYESRIKRFFFHPAEIEQSELAVWREYLIYMETNGTPDQILTLYKRCLMATALYPDFWLQYIRCSLKTKNPEIADVFKTALTFHPHNKEFHALYAMYLETTGKINIARTVMSDAYIDDLVAFDIRNDINAIPTTHSYELRYARQSKRLRVRE